MARPRRTQEERDQQRRDLQEAARAVYREHGAHGVTARAVAQKAGVSPGTIYSAFDSLAGLMRSLWMEPVLDAGRQLEALAAAHPDPVDRIRAILGSYVDFARANPDIVRGTILFVRPQNQPEPKMEDLADLPFHRLLLEAVRDGIDAGAIEGQDAAALTQVLWSGVHGAVALPVNADIYDLDRSEVPAKTMVDLLVRAITA